MKWLRSCLLPRQRDTKCPPKKARVKLRQPKVLFPLSYQAIVANHVVPPGICPGLIAEVFDRCRSCHPHLRESVEAVNIVWVDNINTVGLQDIGCR